MQIVIREGKVNCLTAVTTNHRGRENTTVRHVRCENSGRDTRSNTVLDLPRRWFPGVSYASHRTSVTERRPL